MSETIVDAHVHLWDPESFPTPWLSQIPELNGAHMLPEYAWATAAVPVESFVFVECTRDDGLAEATRVAELAAVDPRVGAIVAWAPVERGNAIRAALERLVTLPLVRGVRRLIEFERSPDFCVRPAFLDGVRAVGSFGLSFDVCITHEQLPVATEMVRACSDVSFILDHAGKPDIASGLLEPWRTNIRRLAACPNVCCKMSGLPNLAGPGWTKERLAPYFDAVLECFTADRVMFAGDWPMVRLAAEYDEWFQAVQWLSREMSPAQRHNLFGATARRVYRLLGSGN